MQRIKVESRHVKGAPECMRIYRFMHEITNPKLIKYLHENIPKSIDEMMRATTTFLMGEVVAFNQARKKMLPAWKQQEILSLDKGKFKASPPMTTLVKKRNNSKFCEFHGEVGHTTDECMHLKRQIEEMIKAKKLSHVIKELKQGKDQQKTNKKGETSSKDKTLAILMNGIIRKPGVRKIQADLSTAHEMLKFPVAGGILTLKSSKIIPIKCATVSGPEGQPPAVNQVVEERIKGAINREYPEQTIMIRSTLTEEGCAKVEWKASKLEQTEEAESVFKQMKYLIAKLLVLTAPEEKEELIVYLATAKEAVNAVLMNEREAKQMSIYFVSHDLRDFIVERLEEDSSESGHSYGGRRRTPETMDGSSCADGFGARLILTNHDSVSGKEIGMPTLRTENVDMVQNDEALEINLDLLKERREQAAIREAKSKAKMEKYFNSKVRSTSFKLGDLVYHSNDASRAEEGGKLSHKWEGPYEVTKELGKGAYKLRDRDGKQLPRTWNIRNLKKCYFHEM
uniref:Reverse transcriptase domain-containing protein n=1 Tax=Tanacetum cinerariifolium TaxID=118510 RepID=A0A6L2KYV3_TANCI|nr:reverse transcriptase domain-containing protein [Tanacetum cinerariifolium]